MADEERAGEIMDDEYPAVELTPEARRRFEAAAERALAVRRAERARRRGWTLRLGPIGTYRITRPSRRVRFGGERWRQVSFGWLIVTKL